MNKPTLAVLYYLSIPGWSFLFFFFCCIRKKYQLLFFSCFFFFFFWLLVCTFLCYVYLLCARPCAWKRLRKLCFTLPFLPFFSFSPFSALFSFFFFLNPPYSYLSIRVHVRYKKQTVHPHLFFSFFVSLSFCDFCIYIHDPIPPPITFSLFSFFVVYCLTFIYIRTCTVRKTPPPPQSQSFFFPPPPFPDLAFLFSLKTAFFFCSNYILPSAKVVFFVFIVHK